MGSDPGANCGRLAFSAGGAVMILAGWLAGSRINRLLHWSRADAEVQRSEVYLINPGKTKSAWGAAVTIRYVANGQVVETSVRPRIQSGVRPWMNSGRGNIQSGRIRRSCSIRLLRWRRTLDGEWSLAASRRQSGMPGAAILLGGGGGCVSRRRISSAGISKQGRC